MKSLILIKTFVLCSIFTFAQTEKSIQIPPVDSLKKWATQMKIPTVGVLTLENAKIDQTQIIGNLKAGKVAPKNTIFNVASITKAITAYLTLRLVSESKWDLDKPLYPYWVDPDVADDPLHKKLTTRHILSHSTGFVNWRWMHETKKLTFDYEPGTKVSYSGEGFEYLRKALENKFKKSFRELAKEYIFEALKMKDSELAWSDKVDESRFAYPHDGSGKQHEFEQRITPNAANDLLTTLQDLGKFSETILAKKGLTEKVYQDMVTTHTQAKEGVGFGLGWVLFKDLTQEKWALLAAGGDKGVAAMMILFPESKSGIIMFTNSDNGRGLLARIIMYALKDGKEILGRF